MTTGMLKNYWLRYMLVQKDVRLPPMNSVSITFRLIHNPNWIKLWFHIFWITFVYISRAWYKAMVSSFWRYHSFIPSLWYCRPCLIVPAGNCRLGTLVWRGATSPPAAKCIGSQCALPQCPIETSKDRLDANRWLLFLIGCHWALWVAG